MNSPEPMQRQQHPLVSNLIFINLKTNCDEISCKCFNLQANYQFSSDELRVFRECNTESFFQRSLPLGTTFGLAAYFAVKQGYIPVSREIFHPHIKHFLCNSKKKLLLFV